MITQRTEAMTLPMQPYKFIRTATRVELVKRRDFLVAYMSDNPGVKSARLEWGDIVAELSERAPMSDVERVLAGWNGPDDWTGDNTWSNGVYSIRYRSTGAGFIGMFRYLGGNGHCSWQCVDQSGVTPATTWIGGRSAEYHARESFATVKEAKKAAICAAMEHALLSNDSDDIVRFFWGAGS